MFYIKLKKKRILILLIFVFFITSCVGKKIKERIETRPIATYVEKPPELLEQDANRYLLQKKYLLAAEMFEEIDKQHPYSKLAKKSKVMAAYAYYLNHDYNNNYQITTYQLLHFHIYHKDPKVVDGLHMILL